MKRELSATVIVPVRNCGSTIGPVVDALRNQTVSEQRYEIVVVDDGSSDGTETWLRERAGGNLRQIRSESDGGPWRAGAVRNRGLRAARGDIVILVDADVLAGPDLVKGHLSAHEAEVGPLGVAGYIYGYPAETHLRSPEILKPPPISDMVERLPEFVAKAPMDWNDGRDGKLLRDWPDMSDCPWPWHLFWTPNVSLPRTVALEIGGFDEGFKGWGFEDTEFAYRLWKRGVRFRYQRAPWVVHYPHPVRSNFDGMRSNIDYMLSKHPVPELELLTWAYLARLDLESSLHVGKKVFEQLKRYAEIPEPDAINLAGVLSELGVDASDSLWSSGAMPQSTRNLLGWEEGSARFVHSSLLGLCVPAKDQEFSSAVLVEHWARLPERVLAGVLDEMRRIAARVVLVGSVGGPAERRLSELTHGTTPRTVGSAIGAALG